MLNQTRLDVRVRHGGFAEIQRGKRHIGARTDLRKRQFLGSALTLNRGNVNRYTVCVSELHNLFYYF